MISESGHRLLIAVTAPESTGFLSGQLTWFRQRGHDVHVLCSPGPQLDRITAQEGATAHPIPMRRDIAPLADLVALFRICRLLRRLRPDVVSVGTPKAGLLVGVAAILLRVPGRVYVLRGLRLEGSRGARRSLLRAMERIACSAAQIVVCVSPSLQEVAVAERLVTPMRTRVIGNGSSNGVDPARFAPTPDRRRSAIGIRRDLGIATDALVIGFVGRLTIDKGVADLLAAHGLLREDLPHPPHLLLIGPAEEQPWNGSPPPGVHVLGPRRDVAECLAACDVLALPSHREGFPNVVLEAACAELPAVVTTATGARDSVIDGETGIIVMVDDPVDLARGLRRLLLDAAERRRQGLAARRRAETAFRPEEIWAGLSAVYGEALGRRTDPLPAIGSETPERHLAGER